MKLIDIKAGVDRVKALAGDPEAAHSEEDRLHQSVLQAIADGTCAEPQSCAALALTTSCIDFPRWCA